MREPGSPPVRVHAPTPAPEQNFSVVACVGALLFGAVGGLAAVAVRLTFRGLQWIFTGSGGSLSAAAAGLGIDRRVLTPVLGALCASIVLLLRRRRARGLGREPRPYIDYVEAARVENGRIPLLPNLWRTGAAAFSVASGAAVGREGSMMQFAAAIVSALGRALPRWLTRLRGHGSAQPHPPFRMHPAFAVACGVAGGVAVAYSAPVAGALFAAEIVLGELRARDLPLLALASFAGWLMSFPLGHGPLYTVSPVLPRTALPLLLLLLTGAFFGLIGPAYQGLIRSLGATRRLPLPLLWAGALVGALSVLDTRVWGNGEQALQGALSIAGHSSVSGAKALAFLLLLRLAATVLCVGTGTIGGVFTPTLFAGGAAGALIACLLQPWLRPADGALFAVAGMGCLISAATHAPLMATVMAVELTGDWGLLPVLLVLNFLAWQVARRVSPEALYAIASQSPTRQPPDAEESNEAQAPADGSAPGS